MEQLLQELQCVLAKYDFDITNHNFKTEHGAIYDSYQLTVDKTITLNLEAVNRTEIKNPYNKKIKLGE